MLAAGAPADVLDANWSISCPHTMTRSYSAPISSSDCISEPEIDEIDGQVFESFETWDACQNYKRAHHGIDTRLKQCPPDAPLPSSSAFMSTALDEFLSRTKEELQRFPVAVASYPPCDSRIYDPGALKMDSVRKPFADLSKLSKLPQVREKSMTPALAQSDGIENSPVQRKTEHVPTKRKKSATQLDFDADKVKVEDLEKTIVRLVSEAAKDLISLPKPRHVSIQMDDTYSKFALEALTVSAAGSGLASAEAEVKVKKGKKRAKEWDDESYSPSCKSAKETDLVSMISRKRDSAKRDIRLPSRYQESAFMEGDQFVCVAPFGSDSSIQDKKQRKRLVDEQRRLQVLKHPNTESPKKVRKSPEKRVVKLKIIHQASKPIPVDRRPLPATKQQPFSNSITVTTSAPVPAVNPVPMPRLLPQPAPKPAAPVPVQEDLKYLYRELYYECTPGRREYYQKKCIKPRVNKKQAVDEAIEVIDRLVKREKQLLYINKLLGLWHRKLDLCSQVITNKVRPEPNASKDTVTVVTSVLKAYQNSVCYKISESLEKQLRQSRELSAAQPVPSVDQQKVGNDATVLSAGALHLPKYSDNRLNQPNGSVLPNGEVQPSSRNKFNSTKRIKKFRSRSLLLPQNTSIVSATPMNGSVDLRSTIPLLPTGLLSTTADVSTSKVNIVDVNQEASDVVIDGRPVCKKFVWSNNQVMTPVHFIPMSRTDSSS